MTFLDQGVIDSVKPIGGGWRYLQEFQGKTWRIPAEGSANSAEDLVKQVREFRITAGIELGDPFLDVCEYVKKVSPNNDRWKGRVKGAPRNREITPLIQHLREWIDRTAANHPRFVLNEEARQRAIVCLKCPQNIRWHLSGCGDCNEEVHRRSYLLRQGKDVSPESDSMCACRLHRVHLASAIFLDQDFLPQRHTDAPTQCWMPQQASTL